MMRCLALDDEPLALRKLGDYIQKTPFLQLVAMCSRSVDALEVLRKESVDLMFVDINMPDLNGMDLVRSLKGSAPGIIFVTAHAEHALEGFKVDAIDYLLKPYDYADFLKASLKAERRLPAGKAAGETTAAGERAFFVKADQRQIRIAFDKILFVESMREYIRIHLVEEDPVMTLMGLNRVEEILPSETFMRVHRSYLVNLKQVRLVEKNHILFPGNKRVPVSDSYREAFRRFMENAG